MHITVITFAATLSNIAAINLTRAFDLTVSQQGWSECVAWGFVTVYLYFQGRNGTPKYEHFGERVSWSGKTPISPSIGDRRLLSAATAFALSGWLLIFYAQQVVLSTPCVSLCVLAFCLVVGDVWGVLDVFNAADISISNILSPHKKTSAGRGRRATILLLTSLACVIYLTSAHSDPGSLSWPTVARGLLYIVLQTLAVGMLGRYENRHLHLPENIISLPSSIGKVLSLQMFCIWTILNIAFARSWLQVGSISILISVLRAFCLYCFMALCLNKLVLTAPSTIAASFLIAATTQRSVSIAPTLFAVVFSFCSLYQVITTLPGSASGKRWLYLLLLPALSSLIYNEPSSVVAIDRTTHPIERLADAGQEELSRLVRSQSQTLTKAVKEYIHRYKRQPPPEFDKWFEIAKKEDYLLIDEFDSIMSSIEPFWGIAPHVLRPRVDSVSTEMYIIRWDIKNHKVEPSADHIDKWQAEYVNTWLNRSGYLECIPDMAFVLNFLDEPRVVAPETDVARATKAASSRGFTRYYNVGSSTSKLEDLKRQDVWPALESACTPGSAARNNTESPPQYQAEGHHFVTNLTAARDVCSNPDHHTTHGLLSSPESMSITHSLVPILSQGAPSIFNDILYPSVWYWGQMMGGTYHEEQDISWEEKRDNLYWAGQATGGYSRPGIWKDMHRARMVLMTSKNSQTSAPLLAQNRETKLWEEYNSTYSSLSGLLDIHVTDTGPYCDPLAEQEMKAAFNLQDYDKVGGAPNPNEDPREKSYGSKYVLDMDGNTFSGRYYRLLHSRSAVLKQTIIREWHDGRLIPWAHFIPISLNGIELGEVMRYLTQEEKGGEIGERIARQGKEWAEKTLRTKDLEITTIRLLMELGRVMDDERDSLKYGTGSWF